jgi:hypothetical protein
MIQTFLNSSHLFATWKPVISSTFFAIGVLFVLACVIVAIAAAWKLFEKAGRPGWQAIIPLYSTWVLFEISGKPGWWALVGLIPYIGWIILFVLYIIAMLELAKRFGQSTSFAIFGLIIFQVIGFLILAFGDATYNEHYDNEQSFQNPTKS